MPEKITLIPLDHVEKKRTYHFPQGNIVIENVSKILVRPSGSHRLETVDGKKWIVPTGWLAIELDVENWTL